MNQRIETTAMRAKGPKSENRAFIGTLESSASFPKFMSEVMQSKDKRVESKLDLAFVMGAMRFTRMAGKPKLKLKVALVTCK